MKTRKGFVSNSSSSCFICEVCGEEASGMGMELSLADMVECVNDHIFCDEHRTESVGMSPVEMRDHLLAELWADHWARDMLEGMPEEDLGEYFESVDGDELWRDYCNEVVPASECPICQFEHITDNVMARYLIHFVGLTRDKISGILKEEFETFKEFADKTK